MLIPTKNRKLIYENLFKEGVMVAKKDFNGGNHPDMDVPNLQVVKALQSLNSRGLVKTQFAWQHYYYSLTNEGIEYLREYLHLPTEIVPATFKKTARPSGVRPGAGVGRPAGADGVYRAPRGADREEYRRKEGGPAGEFRPEFRGGYGRGPRPE